MILVHFLLAKILFLRIKNSLLLKLNGDTISANEEIKIDSVVPAEIKKDIVSTKDESGSTTILPGKNLTPIKKSGNNTGNEKRRNQLKKLKILILRRKMN